MTKTPLIRHPGLLLAGSLSLVVAFSLFLRFSHLEQELEKYRGIYFMENDYPLMTTFDAYHHMTAARAFREGGSRDMGSSPLLVILTVAVMKVLNAPLEKVAYYLPPLLAAFMVLVYYWWGRELGGLPVFLSAGLIGMGSFYDYMRTCLGRFDTDGLIPFFTYGISYLAFKFSMDPSAHRRLAYLASAAVMSCLFYLWWLPARYLIPFLLLTPYAASLFFRPSSRPERYAKMAVLTAAAGLLVFLIFGSQRLLPEGMAHSLSRVAYFVELVTQSPDANAPGAGASIGELKPATWSLYSGSVAGNAVLLILSVMGLLALLTRHPRFLCLMAVPAALALCSLFARRFLIFAVPLYAFGLAYFFKWVFESKWPMRLPSTARLTVFAAVVAAAVAVNSAKAFGTTIRPKFTAYHAALAGAIRDNAPPDALVWNWWDHGYFLEYYAERRTLMNGGRQDAERMFIAAFPLTATDPVLARNWMRFFAVHDTEGLHRLVRELNDFSTAVAFMKEVFSRPEDLDAILKRYALPAPADWKGYLFPQASVYLFLAHDLIEKAYWWYYFGSAEQSLTDGEHPYIERWAGSGISIDENAGIVKGGRGRIAISTLYRSRLTPEPRIVHRRTYKNDSRLIAVWVKEFGVVYLFDEKMHESMFVRLLLLDPLRRREAFKSIRYVPFQGGVWELQ